ncbi:MAG: hydrogenase maturation protease [Chloroflexi bacterium]|nr:hydrogenase maturation protease [Chloroflexota bacterium]
MAALVIGYGNPLRRDDGLGQRIVERLASQPDPDVETIASHQLTPELAEPIGRAALVIFVDANQGPKPGRIEVRPIAPSSAPGDSLSFSHHVDPAVLLVWAQLLYGACPPAWVVSVEGADFGYGTGLSPAVEAAVPGVIERICTIVTREMSRGLIFES